MLGEMGNLVMAGVAARTILSTDKMKVNTCFGVDIGVGMRLCEYIGRD